jgi:alpha-glucosidase
MFVSTADTKCVIQDKVAFLMQFTPAIAAALLSIILQSPDGRNQITVEYDMRAATAAFSVSRDGKLVIGPTPISITVDGAKRPSKPGAPNLHEFSRDNPVDPIVSTIAANVRDHYNAKTIEFNDGTSLELRAYNDGVAFRWGLAPLPAGENGAEHRINAEQLAFQFAQDFDIYYPLPRGPRFFSHQEATYDKSPVSKTAGKVTACVPALVELGDGQFMLISDVNVVGYPGMWLEGTDSTTMQATFPHYPARTRLRRDRDVTVAEYADYLAQGYPRTMPWRAFVLADAPGLLTSTMLFNLATPPDAATDWSWIKPGKVAWDWWNAWNIYDVDFDAGVNQATYKNYIDFASANGLEYVILDEGWSQRGPENLLQVVPALDMPELSAYAASKKVGLILWMTSAALEANFEAAYEQFVKWNIKGLKIDFMQRDDQPMMDFLYRASEEAARHKMLVDFHGGSKPAGLLRTWPNVLTHESVLGLEHSKWSRDANPDLVTLQPFIRMVVGPMDYTPGAMVNKGRDAFEIIHNAPQSQGTRCHQLAMYVVFISPLQMLADTPSNYRKNPGSLAFLRDVPTTWDETRVIEAKVGESIVLARRHGNAWYLGGLTNWSPREVNVKLDFLGPGRHQMTAWRDGTETASRDVAGVASAVTADSSVEVRMAAGGGFAAVIRPE